ncbi:hypothetical protein [Streptomyces sp. NPDC059008]|uniref:hypothetical protein n=1 Tax=Streptomyces sp. NPDC059008 TaxID=3346693 RepID=UPI0036A58687
MAGFSVCRAVVTGASRAGGDALAELGGGRAVGDRGQAGGDVGQAVVDPYGLHAVGAVEELAPGGEGGLGVAALELDVAEVGEHDRPGALAVEAVDVEREVEVFLGGGEVAEFGVDHAGLVSPPAVAVVARPGLPRQGRRVLDRGLGGGEELRGGGVVTAGWWPGRTACMETALGAVLAEALLGRRLDWHLGPGSRRRRSSTTPGPNCPATAPSASTPPPDGTTTPP